MPDRPAFLGVPSYDGTRHDRTNSAIARVAKNHNVLEQRLSMSLLARCFNLMWITAHNCKKTHGVTHFAMLHADVAPITVDWLGVLLEEMEKHDLDVLSTVIPEKSGDGNLVSCGVMRRVRSPENVAGLEAIPEKFSQGRFADLPPPLPPRTFAAQATTCC
ncbi:MAG: hypothetical protein R3C10_04060 [Pirellulales bacterium]